MLVERRRCLCAGCADAVLVMSADTVLVMSENGRRTGVLVVMAEIDVLLLFGRASLCESPAVISERGDLCNGAAVDVLLLLIDVVVLECTAATRDSVSNAAVFVVEVGCDGVTVA